MQIPDLALATGESHVCPGQRLATIQELVPGRGTFVRNGHIYSSVVGYKEVVLQLEGAPILNVIREKESSIVPQIHNIITARITKVNPRFASALILCVDFKAMKEPFPGIIRVQDVRATEQDKIEVYKCFRPGDIVKAEVISLGDSRSYFLSTAKNELGVIFARSVAGATMIPISWDCMQCPKTKMKEFRKVART